MSLKELMELVVMKEKRPNEYKKTLDGITAVSRDILKLGMDLLKEVEND